MDTAEERRLRSLARQRERYRTNAEVRARKSAAALARYYANPGRGIAAAMRWQKEHPERAREYDRLARARRTPEQVAADKAKAKLYREQHRDEINARARQLNALKPKKPPRQRMTREEQNAKARAYYRANPIARAKAQQRTRKWAREHPEKVREHVRETSHRRRARMTSAPNDSPEIMREWTAMLLRKRQCHWCGANVPKATRSIDHITPIKLGGPHSRANTVMACRSCNSAKSDLSPATLGALPFAYDPTTPEPRRCAQCGASTEDTRSRRRFCSTQCRSRHWNRAHRAQHKSRV